MSSTFEDSVFNFDFNLLQQSPKNVSVENKIEKQRKAILIAKKKTIATDFLIKKYYRKKDVLDQAEKLIIKSQEECKQVCINYNSALEKCTQLEKDTQLLRLQIQELQERLNHSENQCEAIQSHANQLQVLVHELETQIESLKIENQLEKSNTKEQTKRIVSQKNEHNVNIDDFFLLRDIVLGKKKLQNHHKIILKKYDKFRPNTDADDSASDCGIDEIDMFDHSSSSPTPADVLSKNSNDQALKSPSSNKLEKNINNDELRFRSVDVDLDSDSGNEVISEDTGRGSSLACSDIEKCFNSPDYYITNSPFSNTMHKEKKNLTDSSTSPITVLMEKSEAESSPLSFTHLINSLDVSDMKKSTKDIGVTVVPRDFILNRNVATSPIKMKLVGRATSPIKVIQQERATSPMQTERQEKVISPHKKMLQEKATSPVVFDKMSYKTSETAEKECLEINSSNILNNNHISDSEVENILSTMRLDCELITPIPKSPAKAQNTDTSQTRAYVCQDAARIGIENDILKTKVAVIEKDLVNNKRIFKKIASLLYTICGDEVHEIAQDCNDNDIILNSHKYDVQLNRSCNNLNVSKSPVRNLPDKLNILDIKKTPEYEKPSEIEPQKEIENRDQNSNEIVPTEKIISGDCLHKSPIKVADKVKRTTKLTRLEKLRKKLVPKSKIRRALTPPIRKIRRRKQLLFKKSYTEHCSKSAIDNKTAFENAVKVMAELKAKEKNNPKNSSILRELESSKDFTQELHIVLSKCDEIIAKDGNVTNPLQSVYQISPVIKSPENQITNNNCDSNVSDTSTVNKTASVNPNNTSTESVSSNSITTRSRSKRLSSSLSNNSDTTEKTVSSVQPQQEENSATSEDERYKRLKRVASDEGEVITKRMLRSSNTLHTSNISAQCIKNNNNESTWVPPSTMTKPIENRRRSARLSTSQKNEPSIIEDSGSPKKTEVITYNDLDIFSESSSPKNQTRRTSMSDKVVHPKESILCRMIEKHAKYSVRCNVKKMSDTTINLMCQKLENGISHILSVPQNESKEAMNNFVKEIQNCNLQYFLGGLMKYLKDPTRKDELYNKVSAPPAPHMTKSEQVLIYIIKELQSVWSSIDFKEIVLSSIEFALFQLNHTPEFGTVESMSHFYAVLCRYFREKSRLRVFILDAMYCIQFKSVALIKQCLDVWMHILPLAHMGIAKSPLVTCLVYLLHFFKCEDKFNRVQEIRDILSRKYFYQVSEWTEIKVLEMFKNAIKELRDIPIEKKMLRSSLIILAKRRGPQWCQKHIIKNMLQPLIENENVSEKVKEFCVSILGPLLKPYPNDMKVHCEIVVNQLLEMLENNVSPRMKEAIFSSLLYMRRHNQTRVTQALLAWNPVNISPELEKLLQDYVREKPAKIWKTTLSKVSLM